MLMDKWKEAMAKVVLMQRSSVTGVEGEQPGGPLSPSPSATLVGEPAGGSSSPQSAGRAGGINNSNPANRLRQPSGVQTAFLQVCD